MTTPVWIGLGSNLGDREGILDAAMAALAETPGVVVEAVSAYHQTSPVGGPPGQGPFLNAAARLSTSLDPHQLLRALQEIENQAGRVRKVRWGERTLDLDILIFGTLFLDSEGLKLPHPRLALRRFVLAPLAEIAPEIVDTITGRTIADLLANLDRRPRLLALEGLPGPLKEAVFRRLVEKLPALGIEDPGDFEGRVRALDADRWPAETLGNSWIVTDYYLDPELIRASTDECPERFAAGPPDGWAAQAVADDRLRELNRWALEHALSPIFVVLLPGFTCEAPMPGQRSVPTLRPDSTDPDAIIEEVLATCRSIEGV